MFVIVVFSYNLYLNKSTFKNVNTSAPLIENELMLKASLAHVER